VNGRNSPMWLGAIVASGMLFRGGVPVAAAATASCEGAADHYAGSQIVVADGARGSPDQSARYGISDQILGHDVCGHQGSVDWPGAVANGAKFVDIKATEGTGFINPQFAQQSNCSYGVGMTRGSYHFARPDVSSGATEQANYFPNYERRPDPARGTRRGVQPVQRDLLRPRRPHDDELDHGLLRHLHQAHEPAADDLHEYELVESVHRQQHGLRLEPALESPLQHADGRTPRRLAHQTIWQFADMGDYLDGPTEQLAGLTRW
jgi:hypothetical protein